MCFEFNKYCCLIWFILAHSSAIPVVWDRQEEQGFDEFNNVLEDSYALLYQNIRDFVSKQERMVDSLVHLNPEAAVVYTISLSEILNEIRAKDR